MDPEADELKLWISRLLPQIEAANTGQEKTQVVAQMLLQLPKGVIKPTKLLQRTVRSLSDSSSIPTLARCQQPLFLNSPCAPMDAQKSTSPSPPRQPPNPSYSFDCPPPTPPRPIPVPLSRAASSPVFSESPTYDSSPSSNDLIHRLGVIQEEECTFESGGESAGYREKVNENEGEKEMEMSEGEERRDYNSDFSPPAASGVQGSVLQRRKSMPLRLPNSAASAFSYATSAARNNNNNNNGTIKRHHHHHHTGHMGNIGPLPSLEQSKKLAKGITKEASHVLFKTLGMVKEKLNDETSYGYGGGYGDSPSLNMQDEGDGYSTGGMNGAGDGASPSSSSSRVGGHTAAKNKLQKLFGGLKGEIEEKIATMQAKEREKRDVMLLGHLEDLRAMGQHMEEQQKEYQEFWVKKTQVLEQRVQALSVQFGIVLLFIILFFLWSWL